MFVTRGIDQNSSAEYFPNVHYGSCSKRVNLEGELSLKLKGSRAQVLPGAITFVVSSLPLPFIHALLLRKKEYRIKEVFFFFVENKRTGTVANVTVVYISK